MPNEDRISAWKDPIFLVIFFVAAIELMLNLINHRFLLNDFKVYYLASESFVNGGKVYGISWGLDEAFFKYSPFTLYLFAPFSFLHFRYAGLLYYFLITLLLAVSFRGASSLSASIVSHPSPINRNILIVSSLVFIANPIYRELHLGNINFLLLALLIYSMLLLMKGKEFAGGVLLGLAIVCKPYMLFMGFIPILHRKWKMIAGIFSMVAIGFLIPVLLRGPSEAFNLHKEWFQTMMNHSSQYESINHIPALLKIHFGIDINSALSIGIIMLTAVLLMMMNVFLQRRNGAPHETGQKQKMEIFVLTWLTAMALIPSLMNADTQLFLLSMPLMMLGASVILKNKSWLWGLILFFIFLFFGLNANDLVGDNIGRFLDATGAVGISNIALVLLCAALLIRFLTLIPAEQASDVKKE